MHSTLTSLFIAIIVSGYLNSLSVQLGYQIMKSDKEGIIWRVFTVLLSIMGTVDVAFASFGVYELILEQNMMKWIFSFNLALLLLISMLAQLYFIHKLQTIIMNDLLANAASSILVFLLLLQTGIGIVVIVNLMKLSSATQFFAIELSMSGQQTLCWMVVLWLSLSLGSDFIASSALFYFEFRIANRGLGEKKFGLFSRICRKTNAFSAIFSTAHLIVFIFFYATGVPFGVFIIKAQVVTVSMFLTMNAEQNHLEDLDPQLINNERLSTLSSLFKGTSFRSESREGHVDPFVVLMDNTSSIIVASPTSSRWNSRSIGLRPDRLNRRNFLADELSISDYGSSSGVDLSTPKIYSEGDFSAQQNQISLPPRYFVA